MQIIWILKECQEEINNEGRIFTKPLGESEEDFSTLWRD